MANRIAVAASQYYGIVGNGRVYVLDLLPDGMVGCVKFFDTKDGLFDVAWSEENENQFVTCSGDGSLRLWDVAHPRPLMAFLEHTAEVYGVDWDLQGKVGGKIDIPLFSLTCMFQFLGELFECVVGQDHSIVGFDERAVSVSLCGTWILRVSSKLRFVWDSFFEGVLNDKSIRYEANWSPALPRTFASASGDCSAKLWDVSRLEYLFLLYSALFCFVFCFVFCFFFFCFFFEKHFLSLVQLLLPLGELTILKSCLVIGTSKSRGERRIGYAFSYITKKDTTITSL